MSKEVNMSSESEIIFENLGCFDRCVAYIKNPDGNPIEWWIRTWNSYGFSKHIITGTFDEGPVKWPKSDLNREKYDGKEVYYNGSFVNLAISGNNDLCLASPSMSLYGDMCKIWVKPTSNYYKKQTINSEIYPIQFENFLPMNQISGFFYCVDVFLPGGWWRIEYPFLRKVAFTGWPILPADTYRDRSLSDENFQHGDDWWYSLENNCLFDGQKEEKSKKCRKEIPHYPPRRIPDGMDKNRFIDRSIPVSNMEPPLEPISWDLESSDDDLWNALKERKEIPEMRTPEIGELTEPNLFSLPPERDAPSQTISNSWINCESGKTYPSYEERGWKYFYFKGCFFDLVLYDKTFNSRMVIKAPFTGFRVWNTNEFPFWEKEEKIEG